LETVNFPTALYWRREKSQWFDVNEKTENTDLIVHPGDLTGENQWDISKFNIHSKKNP
jgi:hypothetical protein